MTDESILAQAVARAGRTVEVIAKVLPPMPIYCTGPACTVDHAGERRVPDETLAQAVYVALREAGLLDPYAAGYSPLLAALDRCLHGRHSIDPCLDCSAGPTGRWSRGNTFLVPGQRIGTTLYGSPIAVPEEQAHRADPDRWVIGGGRLI